MEICTHQCTDRIEKLYYTTYPSDVLCIHCGNTKNIVDSEELIYPRCNDCSNKEKVYKRGAIQKKKWHFILFAYTVVYVVQVGFVVSGNLWFLVSCILWFLASCMNIIVASLSEPHTSELNCDFSYIYSII